MNYKHTYIVILFCVVALFAGAQSVNTKLTYNVVESKHYKDWVNDSLQVSLNLLIDILKSDEFKDSVLNFKTGNNNSFFYEADETVYTNKQVYDSILKATEKPGNVKDAQMDLYLWLKPLNLGTAVGYGKDGQLWIYTYKNKIRKYGRSAFAAHIVHEWTHKLGFSHAYDRTPLRDCCSVPYAIQNIVETIAERRLGIR